MLIKSKKFDSYLKKNILKDLDERSVNGTYIYLVAWLIIGAGTGFYLSNPLYYWLITITFLILGVVRLLVYSKFKKHQSIRFSVRIKWHAINAILPAFLFSVVFCLSLSLLAFEGMFIYLLMTLFALLSAGTMNFAPIKKLSLAYVIALTLSPALITFVFNHDRVIEGLMLVLYASYMVLQANRLNKEYLVQIEQKFALKVMNQQDSLTGIANRRFFDEIIESAWKQGTRSHAQLILILIDIDFFKRVNDDYGHAAGDEVIKNVASILESTCRREGDIVARLGGEEFAILLNSYNEKEKIEDFVEKIRCNVEAGRVKFDGNTISVTCSFGVAKTHPDRDKSTNEFYKIADKELYAAKSAGRNQVKSQVY